jgi:sugar/nucleoside kinase (ribokinase family)
MTAADASRGRTRFDYATVGHVTVDVLEDGTSRPGGSAFYSAVQAARLGLRTLVVTRGESAVIEALLDPFRDLFELQIIPAARTTTLMTAGLGAQRRQRLLAWAGPMPERLALATGVLHLAPVARELAAGWQGEAAFVGLTPQGLARRWPDPAGDVRPARAEGFEPLAAHCDAIVLSRDERASCEQLLRAGLAEGALVAVTDGAGPNVILRPGEPELRLEVPVLAQVADDLGAGDVFAAALFAGLAEGWQAPDAAAFANAAAAVRMAGVGPAAIGDRDAILSRMREGAAPRRG